MRPAGQGSRVARQGWLAAAACQDHRFEEDVDVDVCASHPLLNAIKSAAVLHHSVAAAQHDTHTCSHQPRAAPAQQPAAHHVPHLLQLPDARVVHCPLDTLYSHLDAGPHHELSPRAAHSVLPHVPADVQQLVCGAVVAVRLAADGPCLQVVQHALQRQPLLVGLRGGATQAARVSPSASSHSRACRAHASSKLLIPCKACSSQPVALICFVMLCYAVLNTSCSLRCRGWASLP
jgi:hypothetical protein